MVRERDGTFAEPFDQNNSWRGWYRIPLSSIGRGKLGPSLTYYRKVVGPAAASQSVLPLRSKVIRKRDKPDCDSDDWSTVFFFSLGPLEVPTWSSEPSS